MYMRNRIIFYKLWWRLVRVAWLIDNGFHDKETHWLPQASDMYVIIIVVCFGKFTDCSFVCLICYFGWGIYHGDPLTGPVGLNWMSVTMDAYAMQQMITRRVLYACPNLISEGQTSILHPSCDVSCIPHKLQIYDIFVLNLCLIYALICFD